MDKLITLSIYIYTHKQTDKQQTDRRRTERWAKKEEEWTTRRRDNHINNKQKTRRQRRRQTSKTIYVWGREARQIRQTEARKQNLESTRYVRLQGCNHLIQCTGLHTNELVAPDHKQTRP